MMLTHILLIALGIAALYLGALFLVRGSAALATLAGLSTFAVGATVVAFGTSTPELLVTFLAAIGGSNEVALGNIVGSNIANIALVLGISALLTDLVTPPTLLKKDYPLMLALTAVLYLQSYDGMIGRFDGLILAVICAAYIHHILTSKDHAVIQTEEEIKAYPAGRSLLMTLGGLLVVLLGAKFLVSSGVAVARALGVREIVIGLTLVAVGSSLPELATSVVAAYHRHSEITIGNVVGSNIMNIGMVLGLVGFLQPIAVPPETITYEFPVLCILSLLPYLAIRRWGTLPRWASISTLILYGLFVASLPFVRGM